jgi:hypothetical protein
MTANPSLTEEPGMRKSRERFALLMVTDRRRKQKPFLLAMCHENVEAGCAFPRL